MLLEDPDLEMLFIRYIYNNHNNVFYDQYLNYIVSSGRTDLLDFVIQNFEINYDLARITHINDIDTFDRIINAHPQLVTKQVIKNMIDSGFGCREDIVQRLIMHGKIDDSLEFINGRTIKEYILDRCQDSSIKEILDY